MREAKYEDNQFPELKWKDIPDLLEMGIANASSKTSPMTLTPLWASRIAQKASWLFGSWRGFAKGGRASIVESVLVPPEEGNNARA